MEIREHRVATEADHAGMSWQPLERFGISRQGAHRRFSNKSVFPADLFDSFMSDEEEATVSSSRRPEREPARSSRLCRVWRTERTTGDTSWPIVFAATRPLTSG